MRLKPFRRLLFLSLFSIGLVVVLKIFLKSETQPEVPPRLFAFGISGFCFMAAMSIWLTWRIKKNQNKAITVDAPAGERSEFDVLTKGIIYYAIVEAAIFGIISLSFRIPLTKLLLPYLEFLAPFLVGLPLIFHARRFRDRPKAYAIRFVSAFGAILILVYAASIASGLFAWLTNGIASVQEQVFIGIFSIVIAAPSAYLAISRRPSGARTP